MLKPSDENEALKSILVDCRDQVIQKKLLWLLSYAICQLKEIEADKIQEAEDVKALETTTCAKFIKLTKF